MREPVRQIIEGGASMLHFDVMDGQFVPPISFGDALIRSLRDLGDTFFEAHLMVETPERQFEAFTSAGCQRIIFHAEVTPHAHRLIQHLHQLGMEAGIAINPGTPAEAIRPLVEVANLVLVMTVNPGWGGQKFIPECLAKVRQVRTWSPEIDIEVDGGIDPRTLSLAREAGANVFVVGHHLTSQANLTSAMRELGKLCA